MTQALTSLPVSSLLDVDQISSALLQSTVSNYLVAGSQTSAPTHTYADTQKYQKQANHFTSWKHFFCKSYLNFCFPEAVPGELVCENCQENVLETVGKMIHVMEEQRRPGVLLAVETGRNILLIIGAVHLLHYEQSGIDCEFSQMDENVMFSFSR